MGIVTKNFIYLFVIIVVLAVIAFLIWGPILPNMGYEFGYYAQYNRVHHILESMPDVTIVRSWMNKDVALEDFGFTLLVKGEQAELNFHEGTAEMKETDKSKLKEYVLKQIKETLGKPPENIF